MRDFLTFQHHLTAGRLQPTRHRFQQLGPARAHQAIDADDFAGPHIQRQLVDQVEARGVGDRQVADRQRDLALVAVGWAAQVVIFAHHVAHDPFQVDFGAGGIGGHGAVAQHDRMIGDGQRLFQVVRDIDDADALGGQVADDLEQHLDLGGRQRAGGFVHDQDAAVHRQGTGDFHDLLLAKAQLLDWRGGVDVFFQLGHQGADLAVFFGEIDAGRALDLAAHEDVVAHRQVGGQRQFLVDDGNAAVARIIGIGKADRLAVQHDVPGCGLDDARQDLHQRRFPGAVFPEQRRHLTPADVEVHALQGMDLAIGLGDVAGGQNRFLGHWTSSATGVISQLAGLIRRKAPVTVTVLPVRFAVSTGSSTWAAMARLMPAPAS